MPHLSIFKKLAISVLAFNLVPIHAQVNQGPIDSTDSSEYIESSADTTLLSTDDGPYLYWKDQDSAIVFYFCDNEIIKHEYVADDTIRFYGICKDSTIHYKIPVEPPSVEPEIYSNASRILAISDIHGEYEYFIEILQNTGVIDDNLHWIWGDGHLVILGDVFDRGDKVTECLWLIYNLEREARHSGGVHFTLGNHEVMALQGDLRYVHEKYTNGIVKKSRIKYEDLFGPDMELGRWLKTKHTIIIINNILFVHAGINPEIIRRALDMPRINQLIRDNLYSRSYRIALDEGLKFLFKGQGPLWYRGFVPDERYVRTTSEQVEEILDYFGVSAIVIGHTNQERIRSFYNGRVYAIDVLYEELLSLQGLLWENGKFYRVLGSGELELMD